ncbi:MAG: Dyp-type peroxidase [Nakamurella multipartita]|jgi:putative iron-dependent peroxidase
MTTPQTGIFALGTHAHSYLELTLEPGADPRQAVAVVAGLSEPRTTMGGVNLVVGFRPELWESVLPGHAPAGLTGFTAPVTGPDGFTMPATQRDLFLWTAGGSRDVVFDTVTAVIEALAGLATVADEVSGWTYHRDRDLTGFIDGTENPHLSEAARRVLVPFGRPGGGGSVLLVQKWRHEAARWNALPVADQEQAIGRTKPDSVELTDRPETSHAARTDQDDFGKIFRRNTAFGDAREHGTMFVGFCNRRTPLADMLESMAGVRGGLRDELTRYTTPLTGAYYFVPALDDLAILAPPDAED